MWRQLYGVVCMTMAAVFNSPDAEAQIKMPPGFHKSNNPDEGKSFASRTNGTITVWMFALGRELDNPDDDSPEGMNKACIENIFGARKYVQEGGIYHSPAPVLENGYYNYYIFKPNRFYKIVVSSKKPGQEYEKMIAYLKEQVISSKDIYFTK